MFNHILTNWKTSAAGVLLAIGVVCSVFLQQGVTLGNLGTGSVVGLVAACAAALLGLLARDPGAAPAQASAEVKDATQKLGCVALIFLLLNLVMVAGCSGAQVAQDIVNWMPALSSAVTVVDSTASVLDPAAAPIFALATAGFDGADTLLTTAAKTYLANPGATALQQLQAQVVAFQQEVNASLLSAAKIVNPASQQKAMADINAVATIVNTILALVVSISTKAQASTMAAAARIKIAQVEPLVDLGQTVAILDAHYKLDPGGFPTGIDYFDVGWANLQAAGF